MEAWSSHLDGVVGVEASEGIYDVSTDVRVDVGRLKLTITTPITRPRPEVTHHRALWSRNTQLETFLHSRAIF